MKTKARERIFRDLSACAPPGAIAGYPGRCTWQAVPYETEQGAGVLLSAPAERVVPVVELPLEATGRHAVFLGLWRGGATVGLTGDAVDRHLRPDHDGTGPVRFQEVFWKCADLSGRRLVLRHAPTRLQPVPAFGNCGDSALTHVRIVPMDGDESIPGDRGPARRLVGHDDFLTMQRLNGAFADRESTRRQVEPYRDSDFEKLFLEYWHAGAGVPAYREAIDYAREIGLQLYLARRMGAISPEPPHCVRERDRAPRPGRLSYAWRESRDRALGVLADMAAYQPDGLALFFHKGMPFIGYEEPVTGSFARKTGRDPFALPEDDPDWLEHRAGFITGFLRRLREKLSRAPGAAGPGAPRIAAYVLATRANNLFFGLDPESWIREGLVDEVVASCKFCPRAGRRVSLFQDGQSGPEFDYLVAAARGTPCRVYCDLSPAGDTGRYADPDVYRRLALDLYRRGVHAPCIWDAHTRHLLPRQWNMIRRLGRPGELAAMDDGEGVYHRDIVVRSLGGEPVNRWG